MYKNVKHTQSNSLTTVNSLYAFMRLLMIDFSQNFDTCYYSTSPELMEKLDTWFLVSVITVLCWNKAIKHGLAL